MDFVKYGELSSLELLTKLLNEGIQFDLRINVVRATFKDRDLAIILDCGNAKIEYFYSRGNTLCGVYQFVTSKNFNIENSIKSFLQLVTGNKVVECDLPKFDPTNALMLFCSGPAEDSEYTIGLFKDPLEFANWKYYGTVAYVNSTNYVVVRN